MALREEEKSYFRDVVGGDGCRYTSGQYNGRGCREVSFEIINNPGTSLENIFYSNDGLGMFHGNERKTFLHNDRILKFFIDNLKIEHQNEIKSLKNEIDSLRTEHKNYQIKTDLQIALLTKNQEDFTSQNNAQRTELDDARIQLDKKTEEFEAFKGQFDVLKNMICESGAFNCDVMFGELASEPAL